MLLAQQDGTGTNYLTHDAQGGIRGVMDINGMGFDVTYDYNAFGDFYELPTSMPTKFAYTGQQYDDARGLYFLRARYYDSAIGRFLSQDPYPVNTGNPVELNRYVYTANNPVNFADPSGLFVLVSRAQTSKIAAIAAGALALVGTWIVNHIALIISALVIGVAIGLGAAALSNAKNSGSSSSSSQDALASIAAALGAVATAAIVAGKGVLGGTGDMSDVLRDLNESLGNIKEALEKLLSKINLFDLVKKAIITEALIRYLTRQGKRLLYRNPAPPEHPRALATGFWPTGPYRIDVSIHDHVNGDKPSPFISTTKDLGVAKSYKNASRPIYVINWDRIVGFTVDLTNYRNRQKYLHSAKTKLDAWKSREVLVGGWIPPWAIIGVMP